MNLLGLNSGSSPSCSLISFIKLKIFKTGRGVGGRFQCLNALIKATEDARFIIFILTHLCLDIIVFLQLFL